jgi:hypothetical protein
MAKSPFSVFSSFGSFGSILNVLREVDVRPARIAAETPFLLVFASRDQAFADYLSALMYRGDRQHDVPPFRASVGLGLTAAAQLSRANAVVIVTRPDADNSEEMRVKAALEQAGLGVLLCYLQEAGTLPPQQPTSATVAPANVVALPLINGTLDEQAAMKKLAHAIRQLKAIDDLALARHLPAFREPVVRALIEDVAMANATYSLGTGILSINPVTGLPLTVADTVILTKNQGIMAYKVTLAMGMPADFKSVMPQLAGVVGGGLVLRTIARSIIGLIPGLGILPKVGISFAGTYAIGEAVYAWCKTGEELTEDRLRAIYDKALERGRDIAIGLQQRREASAKRKAARRAAHDVAREAAQEVEAVEEELADEAPIPLPPAERPVGSTGNGVSDASH